MNIWRAPFPKFGRGPGLERVAAAARVLGVDLAAFGADGAVIVGSNGKGSTAAMCAALLQHAGGPVGLFTSPHLLRINERFRIDGEDIGDGELQRHWVRVEKAVRAAGVADQFGAFEFLFLIAADWFAASGCKHTVWEAGIGGRVDPAQLIAARRVALTALDFEHTDLLGDSLEAIACDKADAAPAYGTLFHGELAPNVLAALLSHCVRRQVRLAEAPRRNDVTPPLAGEHQRANAALAIALAQDLTPLDQAAVEAGLSRTRWPGRLEAMESDPLTIIDVGHTPRAVVTALSAFERLRGDRPGVLVCGVSRDKAVAALVGALAPAFGVIICAAAHHKGTPAAEVAALALQANPTAEIVVAESVSDARLLASAKARARAGAVYVAGGLFLAAEFKAVAEGLDPSRLAFF